MKPEVSFHKAEGLVTPPGYSHAASVPAFARMVYVAGQIGVNSRGELAGPTMEEQAEQVFQNIGLALAAAEAKYSDIVKLTIFVTTLHGLAAVRAARDRYINTAAPPTSTLVQVVSLFRPEYVVEVEAVAAVIDPPK